jgi:hypothetical protein
MRTPKRGRATTPLLRQSASTLATGEADRQPVPGLRKRGREERELLLPSQGSALGPLPDAAMKNDNHGASLSPPALGERSHRSLARCLIAVRRSAGTGP